MHLIKRLTVNSDTLTQHLIISGLIFGIHPSSASRDLQSYGFTYMAVMYEAFILLVLQYKSSKNIAMSSL